MKKMVKVWLSVGILMMLAACGSGSSKVDLKENIEIEYGSDLKVEDLSEQEGIQLKEIKEYDNKKLGEQKILVVFIDADEEEIEQEITITVIDTKAPEITFKSESVETTLGDSFDAATNLESVKDPVDGEIAQSNDNTITENGYYFGGDPIASEVGEYTVTVIAFDKNGNKAEKSYKLVIKEKAEENNQPVASNQGGSQTQAPSSNNGSSNNGGSTNNNGGQSNNGGSTTTPPKKVCPNGNEPLDPNLPCDTIITGRHDNYSQCYKNSSGNVVAFPTAEAAWDWAKEVMTNDRSFDIYASFVTTPLSRNDNTGCHCVTFMK